MRYKAVGFDYGGVVGGVNAAGASFLGDVAKTMGLPHDDIVNDYLALNHKINCGEIETWSEFWHIFLSQFNRLDVLNEVTAMSNKFAAQLNTIDGSMLKLIDKIREEGLLVGLFSNTSLERGKEMRALKVDTHFDTFLISAEIHMMKPDPAAFQYLAQELSINLEELIFVDDSIHSLSTASECGFTPLLFTGYEQLLKDLQRLKVIDA